VTPVRGKRGALVHYVANVRRDLPPEDAARKTLCARTLKSPIVEPDAQVTCPHCIDAATFN
jgi:hypothetical protein